ncbi:hypothetical protein ART_3264 [Arthrobacter sp. PAMC 25486]|uniref:magnesium transporter n=1 Tax=Arthrobacter sp. PAMC 25486 TaxID=1494608 RepID=UPI00053606C4|nr:magnesium transporter [Arthrobacter sp. PAMC 25486]AIY02863.1 hypothetical protein ART_3264 [Arthrobacter sp. PAMC 25486]
MTTTELKRAPKKNKSLTLREVLDGDSGAGLDTWLASTPTIRQRSSELAKLSAEQLRSFSHRFGEVQLGRVFASASPAAGVSAALLLDTGTVNGVLETLSPYYIADGIRALLASDRERLLSALSASARDAVDGLLKWEGDSAGGNMTPSFLVLPAQTQAADALTQLQNLAKNVEAANYVYLVDTDGILTGAVSFRGIVTAPAEMALTEFSNEILQSVEPDLDRELAAKLLNDHDLAALPVVQNGRLLGVITADRAAEIIDTETTEDFRRLSSAGGLTRSLKDASIWVLFRSRVVWLVVLVFGNIFSGAGIAHYEELIESVVALVFFLPLLIDSGGNAGSQAATLMVRGLATGDVVMRDWFKILGKELLVASLLGASMAVAVSIIGVVRGGPEIAVVVALTMVIVVIIGSVIGMSLPFLLSKLRLDPASASAPLITSICDGVGVMIYFAIASQILL